MNISELFISAYSALTLNKLRTFLTMLGIVIGVYCVVVLVSLVKGVENFVVGQFGALGSNLILVAPGRARFNQDPALSFTNNKLSIKQLDDLRQGLGNDIDGITPSVRLGKTAEYKSKKYFVSLLGVDSNYLTDIGNISIDKGTNFSAADVSSNARVVVLGKDVQNKLFGTSDPINKRIKIAGVSFVVIGTLENKGFNWNERVLIPYTTLKQSLKVPTFSGFTMKVAQDKDMDEIAKKVEIILLQTLKDDEFTVLSQKDILASVKSILNILSVGLSLVAAISLVVGGIGIMNIMLVSVNERVREIGLRKALGATSSLIGAQFVLESILISLIGGIFGLILAYATAYGVRVFIEAEVPNWAPLIASGFSITVGVLFGTYPALKASKKDPIEALRYE